MYINHQERTVRKIFLVVLITPLFVACGTVQQSARYSCVDTWGRTIPESQRTQENCIYAVPTHELVASLKSGPVSSNNAGTRSQPVSQVYLPTGGYQITRSGTSVFVTQTSRR